MNSRSFFKSLAMLTAGAAVAPGIFIPKFEPVKWKLTRGGLTQAYLDEVAAELEPNPAWIDAEPMYFIVHPDFKKAYYGEWKFETK